MEEPIIVVEEIIASIEPDIDAPLPGEETGSSEESA